MELTSVRSDDKIRVVIVDDHPLMCEGLRRALSTANDIEVVGVAHSRADALAMLPNAAADVVLLDQRLPDGDGTELLREFRSEQMTARVVMLTCVSDERCVRSAIDGGACGFLTKSSADAVSLVDAVRKAHRGVSAISADALTSLLASVREKERCLKQMTRREIEVWRLVSQGLTNGEIASSLFLSTRTVKFHMGNILRKTGARTRAEVTAMAYRLGLMEHAN